MALTQVKTLGIEDDAVTLAKQAGGTDGQIITYDASGNPTAVGPGSDGQVLTSTGAGSPPAFETPAAGVGGATGVDFNDDVKIRSGTGNDLEIYHDGSNTYIKNATGDLIFQHGAENLAQFKDDGAVELYHDNAKRLSTTSAGVLIENTSGNGELTVRGSEGNGAQIYIHADDGDDNEDKWRIDLAASDGALGIQNYGDGGWEKNIECNHGAAVELYHDNSKVLETTSSGVNINGDTTADTWHQDVLIVGTETLALGRAEANNAGPHLHFYKSRNGTWGSNTIVQDNDQLGNIIWYADDGGDYKSEAAMIQGAVDGTPGSDDMPGRIVFKTTTDGATGTTERMRISSVGNAMGKGQIYVGDEEIRHGIEAAFSIHYDSSTAGAGALNLSRTGTGTTLSMGICNANGKVGSIETSGTSTAFNTSSDYRLKENEVAISDGITRIKQLKPYKFNFKTDKDKTLDGFFAHEVSSIVPQAVSGTKDQTKTTYYNAQDERDDNIPSGKKRGDVKDANAIDAQSIDHSHLVPLLTAALKEAIAKIETLETKVAALEAG